MLLHPKELCEVLLADRPVDSKTVIIFTEPIHLGQGSREAEFQLQTSTLGMKTEFAKLKMAKRKYFCKRCGPSSHDMFEERLNNEVLSLLIHTKMFHPRKLYWVLRYVHLTYSQASQIFPYLDLKMSSMGEYICYFCSQSFADFDDFLEHANNKHLKNESARS